MTPASKALALWGGLALIAHAQESPAPAEAPRRSLAEFQSLAEKEGGQLGESRARLEFAHAREDYAKARAWPAIEAQTLITATPGAEGNALAGQTRWNDWGPFSFSKIEIRQPLYTFGALSSARRAARAGTEAEELLLERDRWALRTQVSEFYYGYQLAFEFSELAESTAEDLEKALKKAEKISSRDADKLRVYAGEARVRLGEARKGMEQARIGMAWKTGRYGREVPRWDRANLVARELKFEPLDVYRRICLEKRPELKALRKGLEAKEAMIGTEHGLLFPTLFVAAQAQYAVAPTRERQMSPFAYDPMNDLSGGAAIGLKWDLGIFERQAKVAQARAEWIEAQAKLNFYEPGIAAEVEKNWLDVRQAMETLRIRNESSMAARRIFRDLIVAYTLGTSSDAKPILEALGQYALAEKERLESLYNHNVAVARLEQAIGQTL